MLYDTAIVAGIQPCEYLDYSLGEIKDIIEAHRIRHRDKVVDMYVQAAVISSNFGKKPAKLYEAFSYAFTDEELEEIRELENDRKIAAFERGMDIWSDRWNKQVEMMGGDENVDS
jgi:hypothetical protein